MLANDFRDLILKRTNLKRAELQCPRERSSMTPCIARDGDLAVAQHPTMGDICVGCVHSVSDLYHIEKSKNNQEDVNG